MTPMTNQTPASPNQAAAISANLQERLARVSEQFATKDGIKEEWLKNFFCALRKRAYTT